MEKTVTTKYKMVELYKYKVGKTTLEGKVEGSITLTDGKFSQVFLSEHHSSLPLRNLEVLKLFTRVFLKTLQKLDELGIIDVNEFLIDSFPDTEKTR